jgi:GNAT superfamily N-acetyltransferase
MPPTVHILAEDDLPSTVRWQIISGMRASWPDDYRHHRRRWSARAEFHPTYIVLMDADFVLAHTVAIWKHLTHADVTYLVYGLSMVFSYPDCRGQGYGRAIVRAGTDYIDRQPDADVAMLFCSCSAIRRGRALQPPIARTMPGVTTIGGIPVSRRVLDTWGSLLVIEPEPIFLTDDLRKLLLPDTPVLRRAELTTALPGLAWRDSYRTYAVHPAAEWVALLPASRWEALPRASQTALLAAQLTLGRGQVYAWDTIAALVPQELQPDWAHQCRFTTNAGAFLALDVRTWRQLPLRFVAAGSCSSSSSNSRRIRRCAGTRSPGSVRRPARRSSAGSPIALWLTAGLTYWHDEPYTVAVYIR